MVVLNDMVDINGCKIFVENGEVKTVLSEEIRRNGYRDVETSRKIVIEGVKRVYEGDGARGCGDEIRKRPMTK